MAASEAAVGGVHLCDDEDPQDPQMEASVLQLDCCEHIRDAFIDHCARLREARRRRRQALAVNTVVQPPPADISTDSSAVGGGGGGGAVTTTAIVPIGGAFPTDVGATLQSDKYEGDCVLRTLHQLLAMVDDRGFARSPQQCQFHDAFIRASSRVMYRQDWSKSKPMIMEHNKWDDCPSQILVSTPRRFGKTFRYAALITLNAVPQRR
jgi:hypothetical protein